MWNSSTLSTYAVCYVFSAADALLLQSKGWLNRSHTFECSPQRRRLNLHLLSRTHAAVVRYKEIGGWLNDRDTHALLLFSDCHSHTLFLTPSQELSSRLLLFYCSSSVVLIQLILVQGGGQLLFSNIVDQISICLTFLIRSVWWPVTVEKLSHVMLYTIDNPLQLMHQQQHWFHLIPQELYQGYKI